jgi:hypothetical protein
LNDLLYHPVAVLFVRRDSAYKKMPGCICFDQDTDARMFDGKIPVVAHPPCRSWGILAHFAKPYPGERELALWAVEQVRKWGGVLEHPSGSRLWREAKLPAGLHPDKWGGYTIEIDQYHFGHVAHKPTKLYIVGRPLHKLPPMPKTRTGRATRSIAGNVTGTKRCTDRQREYTPKPLREWLTELARGCNGWSSWPA